MKPVSDASIMVLECDPTVGTALAEEFEAIGLECIVAEKNKLTGSPELVIEILKVLGAAAPVIAVALIQARRGVRRIKLGDLELENPSEEQVGLVLERWKGMGAAPEQK